MENLTILVSTVDGNILNNKGLLNLDLNNNLKMIIINQMIRNPDPLILNKPNCRIINEDSTGLSASRNRALDEVDSGLVIIADDDVHYVKDFDVIIRNSYLKFKEFDLLTFQIQTPEGVLFKTYPNYSFVHDRFTILKVSSISITFRIEKINEGGLRFDKDFGLGGKYGTGEENLFLMGVLRKKIKMRYIPKIIVIHPWESSGKILDNIQMFNKGVLFKRLYGIIGLPVIILFLFIKRKEIRSQNQSFIKSFKSSLKGYFLFK